MKYTKKRAQMIVQTIKEYMQTQGAFDEPVAGGAKEDVPAMQCHIKGLIYAQLSNQTRWAVIAPKLGQIDALFFGYDAGELLRRPPVYYVEKIRALKCGNRSIQKQMDALHQNIRTLERIEGEYGTLDAFVVSHPPEELVDMLSKPDGAYKLYHIGYALAWQYLRAAGVDAAKPDVHLRRMLGNERLGFSQKAIAAEKEINPVLKKIAEDTNMTVAALDDLLWAFCASGYGNICTAKPSCKICPVRRHCNKNRGAKE